MPPVIDLHVEAFTRDDVDILTDIRWHVMRGEHWAVLGANGAGKSSLLSIVAGYEWPSRGRVAEALRTIGAHAARKKRYGILSQGEKQRVMIARALVHRPQLLILDEPTAVLTPSEVKDLFDTVRELKNAGTSIIFISHKLHEPLEIADRIVTIRRGEIVGEVLPDKTTKEELAQMIVGRKIVTKLERVKSEAKNKILDTFMNFPYHLISCHM